MSPKHFFAGLAITTLFQILLCVLLIWILSPVRHHAMFIAVTILAMIFFSVFLYAAAKISARNALVRLYIQLIMIAVFLKMLLCLALIVVYRKGFEPADNFFIWPFLIIYISSTIYEIIFMERVGREKPITKT